MWNLHQKLLPLLLLFAVSQLPVYGFQCPKVIDILPCSCDIQEDEQRLICEGPLVTQDSIDTLFSSLRSANNVSGEPDSNLNLLVDNFMPEKLKIHLFVLRYTSLTVLDLRPFVNVHFTTFDLADNPKLETIVMSVMSVDMALSMAMEETDVPTVDPDTLKFVAHDIRLDFCNLREKQVGNLIKFVEPLELKKLSLSRNKIQGAVTKDLELIPGLSALTKLTHLSLHGNQIRKIAGRTFESNVKLTKLDLAFNEIVELDANAFLQFEDSSLKESKKKKKGIFKLRPFIIDLSNNLLTDGGLHPLAFHGLHLRTTTFVSLDDNLFDTISLHKFDQLGQLKEMRKGKEFDLYFSFFRNPLVCDHRLKWLQEGKQILEKFFWGVTCHNDGEKDLFDVQNTLLPDSKTKTERLGSPTGTRKGRNENGMFKPLKKLVKPYVKGFWSYLETKMLNAELL